MVNRILFFLLFIFLIHIFPSWNYEFESCCINEKSITNTTRLLSCPLNFVIKLRSVIFYTGNGCSRSTCQKRFNKHYLQCNNHRTCSISIQCILMDSSTCSSLTKLNHQYSEHLIVDYDCILYKPEILSNNKTKEEQNNENILLFSAKINIESPPDLNNDSLLIDNEHEWKEYFLKKFLYNKQFNESKTIIIQQQRSLWSDIFRTIIIFIIFTFILMILIIIISFIYKRIILIRKRKLYEQEKHQPFPTDDAYDNLKGTTNESASDCGTTTDV